MLAPLLGPTLSGVLTFQMARFAEVKRINLKHAPFSLDEKQFGKVPPHPGTYLDLAFFVHPWAGCVDCLCGLVGERFLAFFMVLEI